MSHKLGQKKRTAELLNAYGFDPSDSWAHVELYRWQHGELPPQDQSKAKPLKISEGLKAMGQALLNPSPAKWAAPLNIASVLKLSAKELEKQDDLLALCEKVANLNPDAGEIGAGMLANLVQEARRLTPLLPPS